MKPAILLPLFLQAVMAQQLAFVGSYGGSIVTLQFNNETGELKQLFTNKDSAPSPSWQEISKAQKFLYTVEETTQKDKNKGAVTSYSIEDDGQLRKVSTSAGMVAPVHLAISPDQNLIVTANYGSASVSAYNTNPSTGEVNWAKSWEFELPEPGAVPERQEAPHPHHVIFEPTGKVVLVTDLGADIIRMFTVGGGQDPITEIDPVKVKPGTGPRHAVFYPATDKPKFYYVVGELSNTLTVFSVEYTDKALKLTEIQTISTLPEDHAKDKGPAAGEIILHPNGKHLYVSNRLDTVFPHANSIASYEIDESSGRLKLLEVFNSGVVNIRHLSIHPSGEWLITEGQDSNNIKSFQLDPNTGKVEKEESSSLLIEKPVCLQWLTTQPAEKQQKKCGS
ncbi:hypothetical protein CPC735_068010 [Coccidioides posadasii C735 delta SOWgp]|uniref:6-phosphogluconolactonase n=1 Tax=Coccidioides posadasii (strain C735) TaxID=222929 RepID=C5P0B1_COCP7|nr:hypothetical protein CPC735_068010 [Coccidioides posadasii C735 delta SOWgp]EER29119.1 hypothetical protein CPC735_068010 [Coccidioides posadasii C735 delta SOWgp]|eukprot:XP_003071264.1 hypothetical protein CPC735_068010 [Coccidioides posadasii C735 delta SOWgp]